ncbi:methyltransferase-like protein 7A [Ixodes scapularis]
MYAFLSYTLAAILASVTLFFVALKLSKAFREAFFVRVFMPAAGSLVKDEFVAIRREVLSSLNDLESHDPELKKDGIVRVLEVGAGFGANFEFIQRKVKYWNIEPNAEFGPEFMKAAGKNPLVELERCVRGYGEDMAVIPDGFFDAVVVTHLLCSVRDAKRVLGECKRVLAKVRTTSGVGFGQRVARADDYRGQKRLCWPSTAFYDWPNASSDVFS